ncbi:DUF2938 domain-containing protein [Pseudomonas sp. JS3066]|uniref:DUF2938 domain-containing protein n=1 Tax=unclassified Pseudomonas TaxID=196821 RepID=UPI000EA9C638|nr:MULTISPECIES: DUF2938 domain-containing protein [unclassified Pseudomonas]AYF86497.1 DUF2938 domain-containing protein [Pseudomonas sp. DY-1]MDH4654782.1 DUF2938 domain-containing protein [Pseudomonas sp. BN606]WVK96048.1 DUF2938 domain-containing protein [Pseudomonas sp. JS3066]
MNDIIKVVCIGIGATAVMDIWLLFLKRLGVPSLNFAFIGRWVGHLLQGRIAHDAIAKAEPIPGELALGWGTHYAIGIGFASLLVMLAGTDWAANPTLLPAVLVGMGTVVAPLLVMQPAMGAGFFASKTPTPLKNCLRSLANHSVFGLGMFLAAILVDGIVR